jgi:hypothetical protein
VICSESWGSQRLRQICRFRFRQPTDTSRLTMLKFFFCDPLFAHALSSPRATLRISGTTNTASMLLQSLNWPIANAVSQTVRAYHPPRGRIHAYGRYESRRQVKSPTLSLLNNCNCDFHLQRRRLSSNTYITCKSISLPTSTYDLKRNKLSSFHQHPR